MPLIFLSISLLFWDSERLWEGTEYFAEAVVFLGCLGEFLTEYEHVLVGEANHTKRHRLGRLCAIVLMAGLAVELMALVRTNELFTGTVAALNKEAGDARRDAAAAIERASALDKETAALRLQLAQQGHRAAILHDPLVNDRLVTRLKPFARQKFEIQYCPFTENDQEQFEVVAAFEYILGYESKWESVGHRRSGMCVAEVLVMVRSTAPQATQTAGDALMDALADVPSLALLNSQGTPPHQAVRSQPAKPPAVAGIDPSSPDVVLIFVGPHP